MVSNLARNRSGYCLFINSDVAFNIIKSADSMIIFKVILIR
jgi:hypothetical protein